MIKKKRAAWYRLFSIVMVLTLLAGMVVPVAPAVAYAEGDYSLPDSSEAATGVDDTSSEDPDSPPNSASEDDGERMTVNNSVYNDDNKIDTFEYTVSKEDPTPLIFTVEINGEEVEAYTMADLKAMPRKTKAYGETGFYVRAGVDFIDLLESLDIDYQNWTVKLKMTDVPNDYTLNFSYVIEPLLAYEESTGGSDFEPIPLKLYYGDGSNHKLVYQNVVGINVIKPESFTPPELVADSTDNTVGNPIELTFTDDEAWRNAVSEVKVNDSAIASDDYTLAAGKLTIDASVFPEAGDYAVVVSAAGYSDATVNQQVLAAPVGGEMRLSCDSGLPGLTVFITGSGFAADTAGTIWFDTNDNSGYSTGISVLC
jgi:hypothetical protein